MQPPTAPLSLTREAAALRAGRPPLPEHTDRLCARIEQVDPLLHAFVPEPGRHHRLAGEARALAARYQRPADRPPLYGVAVGVKDIVRVDGLATHAGSALPPGVLGGRQAELVGRLRAAGALVAGKTVTAEFAMNAPGPTRNPHGPAHTPGGSSSGSAAAVAAGLVPLAVGTQTVGSVIRPAAYCGVVGFRPTYGRIPFDGVIPNAPSLDTAGFFTADVAGAALAASVLCDGWRPGGDADDPPVLGVPAGPYLDQAGPAAAAAFAAQLETLAAAGLTLRRVELIPDFDEVARHLRTVCRYEAAQAHADWFARFGGLYRHETAAAIRHGQEIDPDDYLAALRARAHFAARVAEIAVREGVGLWLAPAATGPAPLGLESTGDAVMSVPWSWAGLPAVTLPAGRSADGLPLGLQCVGAAGADERLLAGAARLERALAAGTR
ncbi:amidase [Kitasatospora sp. NBC_00240]|uniref:amidase n=1 Tax=Kitasatospora sp. NBC_00240 TaxID=2903567 RepID=UPI00225766B7|nr:amidase [Kitasatospora sp. NBC_00240]MCX5211567.1 amidase [Kitasatospora sp. NBC_00240]